MIIKTSLNLQILKEYQRFLAVSKIIKIRSYWLMVFLKCSFFACLSRFAYQIPCGPFELAVRKFYRSILWSSITRTPALIESGIITRDIVPPCLFKMLTGNISQVYSALLNTSVRCFPPARGLFFRFLFYNTFKFDSDSNRA